MQAGDISRTYEMESGRPYGNSWFAGLLSHRVRDVVWFVSSVHGEACVLFVFGPKTLVIARPLVHCSCHFLAISGACQPKPGTDTRGRGRSTDARSFVG